MKIGKLFVILMLFYCISFTTSVFAQIGDQILDGISETGLIARYTFKEDVRDWSRNNLHGNGIGTNLKFVEDSLFGHVISLSKDSEAFVSLPSESVIGEESLSISG